MSDLISRSAVLKIIDNHRCDTSEIELGVLELPAVNLVVHGEWKMRGGKFYCSICGKKALEEKDCDDWYGCEKSNFCPNCGADMRKNGASRSNDGVEGGEVNDRT